MQNFKLKISEIEIRACRSNEHALKAAEMRYGTVKEMEFLVVTMKTDAGISASTFGFGGTSALGAAHTAATSHKPFFAERDALYREKHWHDWRMADRWWHHVPMYAYSAFDNCCWLLAAHAAELPLYKYLGGYRDRVPIYGSSLVLPTPAAFAEQALGRKQAGWAAYKLHPPGNEAFDLEAYRLCREAVGPDFKPMADPVAAYNQQQAMRMGRELEKLGYYWLEEPLFDVELHGLRELTRALDIPICGTEVMAGSQHFEEFAVLDGSAAM